MQKLGGGVEKNKKNLGIKLQFPPNNSQRSEEDAIWKGKEIQILGSREKKKGTRFSVIDSMILFM